MFDAPLFPEQASTAAAGTDLLLLALVLFSTVASVAICFTLLFFVVYYRHDKHRNRRIGDFSSTKIEIAWMTIPAVLLVGLFFWGAALFYHGQEPPRDTLDVYVVGKQWMWKLQHPEGQREINELHVPVNQPVRLWMTSQDVIHSFYVPSFRVKQDLLPGRYTTLWFEAIDTGEYHLFCAEYCGTEHSYMRGTVIVQSAEEYARWLESTSFSNSMAADGKVLFQHLGCSGCHGAVPTVPAPKLDGLYGRLVTLMDGSVVQADANYLRDSILLPSKHITAGFEDRMPSYQGQVSEEDLFNLLEYIKSLRESGDSSER